MRAKIIAAVLVSMVACFCGCGSSRRETAEVTGGDAERGAQAISRYGCGSCHTIRGVSGANGRVGPPLDGIGNRTYVAGILPNTPENMAHWVQDPTGVNSQTVMPNLGVGARDAIDIAAYLYSLK